MSEIYDSVIIGGGPGGYVAAIRASQLGKKVVLVEKRATLGGTCLNIGCIPSKALLDSSELYQLARNDFAAHGIKASISLDLPAMQQRKDQVVAEVCSGVEFLIKKNKIKRVHGRGSVVNKNKVIVYAPDSDTDQPIMELSTKGILLATGAEPMALPGLAFDGEHILSSTDALQLQSVPEHLLIVGAGVIGLELGSVWQRLGAKVTIVEMLPSLLFGSADKQMAALTTRILQDQGLQLKFGCKVAKAEILAKNKIQVSLENTQQGTEGKEELVCDKILVAIGRRPFFSQLGLENLPLQAVDGCLVVDVNSFQTEVSGIYAIGDLIKGPMLAHRAMAEGIAWAERLAGHPGYINYGNVPYVVYTWPELAWVGKTEEQLKSEGIAYKTGRALFRSNGRAKAMHESQGQIKILSQKDSDRILGIHVFGPRASDLIAEAVVAMEFSASAEDIARSFHAHPTLSEIMQEAALDADKRGIHS